MKLSSFIPKREELKTKLQEIYTRFPFASCISIAVTLLFFSLIATNFSNETSENIIKVIMSLIITFFLSVWIVVYMESIKAKSSLILLSNIVSIIFGWMFYYFLSIDIGWIETVTFFILTLFGVISLLFSAPYLKYLSTWKYKETSYYIYFYRVSTVIFMSLIVWWALALGWSLAIMAIQVLFDIWYSWSWDMYGYWITTALALLTPLFALSELPKKWEFEKSRLDENLFFNFLIHYIAIPFIYVYFFILYAYTLKVLLDFSNWPKGEVSWMVIGFSLFGYIIYMFSYIFETKKDSKSHKLIQLFRKYFPYIVLPQIAMLFYAIFLRIGQYDLTMNRYFVVAFGVWLLVTSLYLIISRVKSLLFIPLLLTFFTLIISIGPWSVYHLPLTRQVARLESNLNIAWIISTGKIIPLKKYTDIDKDLSNQIYDGIDYVCDFNSCEKIKELFPIIYSDFLTKDRANFDARKWKYEYYSKDDTRKYSEPSRWEIVSHITEKIKVQRTYGWNYDRDTIYFYNSESIFPLNIVWYDIITDYNSNSPRDIAVDMDLLYIHTDLREFYKETSSTQLSIEERTFVIENDIYLWKFILQSASIFSDAMNNQVEDSDSRKYSSREYIEWILLLKKK